MSDFKSSESRVGSPEIVIDKPSIPFSSFKPSKSNVKELKDGSLLIRLAPGEVRSFPKL
jgi:polynucleotide 5'-hydroxyl-kinase GRC3/NOL9